jgi:hypothetical protein
MSSISRHTAAALALASAALIGSIAPAGAAELRRAALSGAAVDAVGGSFRLLATLGEAGPVASTAAGGGFALAAGFWAGFDAAAAVAVPPAGVEAAPPANALAQNAPNPFESVTSIEFAVGQPSPVRLAIYDTSGRRVALLASGARAPGRYRVDWRGLDDEGRSVAEGIYLLRLDVGPWSETRKVLRLR